MGNNPLDNLPAETGQPVEDAPMMAGNGTYQEVNPVKDRLIADRQKLRANAQKLRTNAQNLKQLVGSNEAWAHWDYTPEEWARFDAIDWKPRRRACFCVLMGLISISGGLILYASAGFVAGLLTFVILALTMFFFFWISRYTGAALRHKARQQAAQPYTVTIANQGIWEAGTYFSLENLAKVTLTTQPPVLHFRSNMIYTETDASDTPASYRIAILVPHGHEEEAAQLLQRFQTEVIEAQEQAWKRWRNPPEPGQGIS